MLTRTKDGQWTATMDPAADHVRPAAEPRMQDLMAQLVRQGLDISLRSLQVWADLARQLTALRSPAGVAVVTLTYDLFEKLLVAQRQVVEELIATQRQFAQQLLEPATASSNGLARR